MEQEDERRIFENKLHSILNVFIMSLGEIDKVGAWLELTPHVTPSRAVLEIDTLLLLAVFLFLMPIVLMNLLVNSHHDVIACVRHSER